MTFTPPKCDLHFIRVEWTRLHLFCVTCLGTCS